jgi:integrase
MLNKYFKIYNMIDLNDCVLITDFLKRGEKSHLTKKSSVLSRADIDTFLLIPSDDDLIVHKCVLIVGVHGLLRISELTDLTFKDVSKKDNLYSIYVAKSKTDIAKKGFVFYVSGTDVKYIDDYLSCFDKINATSRFFCKLQNGKGTARCIGKNTIGKKLIAQKLKICDPQLFTGHCFRRSGATILSDSGASKLTLKRAGR